MPIGSSPSPSGETRHALRIRAGRGSITVSGLSDAEAAVLERDWSRCSPERLPEAPADADLPLPALDRGTSAWDGVHESLVHQATAAAIAADRGRSLMFHGACLASPADGSAIVLAAASGTGKTTATLRLGPHFGYQTDETAIVDVDNLSITPFPKPLSLLQDGRRPKRQAGPEELGLGPTGDAVLRRIAVLDRVRDPEGPVAAHAERMDLLDALEVLAPQTSSLSALDRGLVRLCRVIDRLGGVQRLHYAEADDLREVVEGLLAAAPEPQVQTWEALDEAELRDSVPDDETVPGRLRRVAADCGIALPDGRIVLLVDTRLVALGGLGPALWALLETPRTEDGLLNELALMDPLPPEAAPLVARAVEALEAEGLVFRDGSAPA